MIILGIESSCDETAAAVVESGRRVLSNRIASQVPLHQRFGGVVPEIASRAHVEQVLPVVVGALEEARVSLGEIDAIAVTRGPGLIGCLLIGVEFAKGIAVSRGLPLIAVQHVAGHLYSPYIGRKEDAWGDETASPAVFEPYIGLAISGGHSSILLAEKPLQFVTLGETLDDAVGEAYDKIAKLIGLGYPGGPIVDQRAARGDAEAFALPRPLINKGGYDFSFSGLKTAFAREVEKLGGAEEIAGNDEVIDNLCASFQAACIDVLIARAKRALKDHRLKRLAVVGGVACNKGLRAALAERLPGVHIAVPEPEYCTDNAAMIAGAAFHVLQADATSTPQLSAVAQLDISASPETWQA